MSRRQLQAHPEPPGRTRFPIWTAASALLVCIAVIGVVTALVPEAALAPGDVAPRDVAPRDVTPRDVATRDVVRDGPAAAAGRLAWAPHRLPSVATAGAQARPVRGTRLRLSAAEWQAPGIRAAARARPFRCVPRSTPSPGARPSPSPGARPAPSPGVRPSRCPSSSPTPRSSPTPKRSQPSPAGPGTPDPSLEPPGGDHWYNPLSWMLKGIEWIDASLIQTTVEGLKVTVLSTIDVTAEGRVRDLWTASMALADSLMAIVVIAAGMVMMTHDSLQIRYGIKDGLARVVWAAISANCSLLFCHWAIQLADAITDSLTTGVTDEQIAATLLPYEGSPAGLVLLIVDQTASLLMLLVALTWVARNAIMVVAVIAAPLALICHALPKVEAVALMWWRAVAALLLAQLGQALTLIAAVRVFFGADGRPGVSLSGGGRLVNAMLAVCLAYVLLRIPAWARKAVFRGGGPNIASVMRVLIVQQVLRKVGAQALAGVRRGRDGR